MLNLRWPRRIVGHANLKKRISVVAVLVLLTIGAGYVIYQSRASGLIGDLNNDSQVNVLDLSVLLSAWGTNNNAITLNLGTTGVVGIFDLSILLTHWGDTAGPTPTFITPIHYVAMGDSVASGEGINYGWVYQNGNWKQTGPSNPVWEPSTDLTAAVQDCHRSVQGYPTLAAGAYDLLNLSCSGASVPAGVLNTIKFNSSTTGAAQLGSSLPGYALPNPSYASFRPQLVTITLGMDDIGFSDILTQCYTGSCGSAADDTAVNAKIATFEANLKIMLSEISNRGVADGYTPWVILTNYYDPFNDSAVNCSDINLGFGFGLSSQQITWLESKLQLLNQNIAAAGATYSKIKVADISKTMTGHQFCSTDPWVYGPSIIFDDSNSPAPFHPTPSGQQAIANVILSIAGGLKY